MLSPSTGHYLMGQQPGTRGVLEGRRERGWLGDCQLTMNDPKIQRVSKSPLGSLNTETREKDPG